MTGTFGQWQPQYAEVGIATFPVEIVGHKKRPLIKGYLRTGLRGSRALAGKFGDADAFGIPLSRSKITILDVDTPDENVLADAMAEYGPSPFVVRSLRGRWQAYYRNGGEPRSIKQDKAKLIDILGSGITVAAPSKGEIGSYQIVQGTLDDLRDLPVMEHLGGMDVPPNTVHPAPHTQAISDALAGVQQGQRNDQLWRYLMQQAPFCDDVDALIDVARTAASAFNSPLPDTEVVKAAKSAWQYQSNGRNFIARGRPRPEHTEATGLIWMGPSGQDAHTLLAVLRHNHVGNASPFPIANVMAKQTMPAGWHTKRLAAARDLLIELGYIVKVRAARTGAAALYAWGQPEASALSVSGS